MVIRIFPHSKKEFNNESDLQKWLKSDLILQDGKYLLRTINGVGSIPVGSMVLFRFNKNIVGQAVVERDIKPINKETNGVTYKGIIKFNISTIKVYRKPLPIGFVEKLTDRSFQFARAYYKFYDYSIYDKIQEEINRMI